MTSPVHHALEQALACHRSPGLLGAAMARPLPSDMLELLRLAAGDEALAAECAAASGETEATVVEAARFFVVQMQFAPGADSYRILGVTRDAPDARIKEHYRWLVRWLHPDRNPDGWVTAYADRINRAWQDLRLPERRQAYDAQWPEVATQAGALPRRSAHPLPLPPQHDEPSLMSTQAVQRLPFVVLGGLGALAGAVLALMWYAREAEPRLRPARPAVETTQAAPANGGAVPDDVVDLDALLASQSPAAAPDTSAAPTAGPASAQTSIPDAAGPVDPVPATVTATPSHASAAPADPAASRPPAPALPASREPVATRSVALAPSVAPTPRSTPPPAMSAPPVTPAPTPSPTAEAAPLPAVAAPVAAMPSTSPPTIATTPPEAGYSEAEAHALLRRFSGVYRAGDITSLMRLFTHDASNNRGGRDAIVFDYQSLFSGSDTRDLDLDPTGWMQRDDGAVVLARYHASVSRSGDRRPSESRGNIRFELRREEGMLRISRITHDSD